MEIRRWPGNPTAAPSRTRMPAFRSAIRIWSACSPTRGSTKLAWEGGAGAARRASSARRRGRSVRTRARVCSRYSMTSRAATAATWAKRFTLKGARAVHPADGLGLGDEETHAESREPRHLRECAEGHNPRPSPREGDPVRRVGIVTEVAIRLVDHYERGLVAERGEKGIEGPAPHDGGGGIVRRAEEDHFCPRRHARTQVVEIRLVASQGARHDRGAGEPRLDRVRLEGRVRHEDLVARLEGGVRDERDDLVTAVAHDDPVRPDAEPLRNSLPQLRRARVGVEMSARGLAPKRFHYLRRRSERIFVGGESPQGGQAQLCLERFERLACLIWSHCGECVAPYSFHGSLF